MLQRSTQVGEFYRMHPPAVFDKKKTLPSSYMGMRLCLGVTLVDILGATVFSFAFSPLLAHAHCCPCRHHDLR